MKKKKDKKLAKRKDGRKEVVLDRVAAFEGKKRSLDHEQKLQKKKEEKIEKKRKKREKKSIVRIGWGKSLSGDKGEGERWRGPVQGGRCGWIPGMGRNSSQELLNS